MFDEIDVTMDNDSDLITRAEAVKAALEWNVCPYEDVFNVIKYAIAVRMHAVPKAEGWVSVKDRLPSNQDIVIVAINDDSGDTPYKYAYFGWYMSEAKCWIVDDEIRRGEVYAWMPLPEPPDEEEKC